MNKLRFFLPEENALSNFFVWTGLPRPFRQMSCLVKAPVNCRYWQHCLWNRLKTRRRAGEWKRKCLKASLTLRKMEIKFKCHFQFGRLRVLIFLVWRFKRTTSQIKKKFFLPTPYSHKYIWNFFRNCLLFSLLFETEFWDFGLWRASRFWIEMKSTR